MSRARMFRSLFPTHLYRTTMKRSRHIFHIDRIVIFLLVASVTSYFFVVSFTLSPPITVFPKHLVLRDAACLRTVGLQIPMSSYSSSSASVLEGCEGAPHVETILFIECGAYVVYYSFSGDDTRKEDAILYDNVTYSSYFDSSLGFLISSLLADCVVYRIWQRLAWSRCNKSSR
jgi:hypothetical protein